jgi:hypothetical protein
MLIAFVADIFFFEIGKSVAATISTVPCSGCLVTRILRSPVAEQSGWSWLRLAEEQDEAISPDQVERKGEGERG